MNEKELTSLAKQEAAAVMRWSNYRTARAAARLAFDAETERRTAELAAQVGDAKRAYQMALASVEGADDAEAHTAETGDRDGRIDASVEAS